MADVELFHFHLSHYNEKARWALDFKGIPHVRRALLPGLSKVQMRRMSGQEQVPVLRDGEQAIAGSAEIIDHLERRQPEPALYPKDDAARRRALDIQSRLDADLGPAVRRAKFDAMLEDPAYTALCFTWDRSAWKRAGFRAMVPAIVPLMRKEMKIHSPHIEPALAVTRETLDWVAREAGPDGYLVGGAFSVADLTAASLLSAAVHPKGGPEFPEPYSPVLESWIKQWADHPGAAWVRTMYDRHRGVSAATSG